MRSRKRQKLVVFIGLLLFFISHLTLANPIVLKGNQVITTPTFYSNVVLDMTNGQFTIKPGGSLTIQNSVVSVALSQINSFFAQLQGGNLTMVHNTVKATVTGIKPNPNIQALAQLIRVDRGIVDLRENMFSVNLFYTVGFFLTNVNFVTSQFTINDNTINNFHGGIYLVNSSHNEINRNNFNNISFSNIYDNGNNNRLNDNVFTFPGNLMLGDAIDVVNVDGATITSNTIASSSNYGIFIRGSKNVLIDNNKISDGLAYAIFIADPVTKLKNTIVRQMISKNKTKFLFPNTGITVTHNYIALNRYGLAGENVNDLKVSDNTFVQRFTDHTSRQFWTNNDNLLLFVTGFTWFNNFYKEGFTQANRGDNSLSLKFVPFPAHGGVSL